MIRVMIALRLQFSYSYLGRRDFLVFLFQDFVSKKQNKIFSTSFQWLCFQKIVELSKTVFDIFSYIC